MVEVGTGWSDGVAPIQMVKWRPSRWSVCLPLLIFPCTVGSRSSRLLLAHQGGPGKGAIKLLWYLSIKMWNISAPLFISAILVSFVKLVITYPLMNFVRSYSCVIAVLHVTIREPSIWKKCDWLHSRLLEKWPTYTWCVLTALYLIVYTLLIKQWIIL